jgi:hypothetical protein
MGTEEAQQISYPAKNPKRVEDFQLFFIVLQLSFFSLDSQRAGIYSILPFIVY